LQIFKFFVTHSNDNIYTRPPSTRTTNDEWGLEMCLRLEPQVCISLFFFSPGKFFIYVYIYILNNILQLRVRNEKDDDDRLPPWNHTGNADTDTNEVQGAGQVKSGKDAGGHRHRQLQRQRVRRRFETRRLEPGMFF
jgi:hypothetical protein